MDHIINICPMNERPTYIAAARIEARRLHEIADTCGSFEEAYDLRMEASELIDLAACAADTLGAEGLII